MAYSKIFSSFQRQTSLFVIFINTIMSVNIKIIETIQHHSFNVYMLASDQYEGIHMETWRITFNCNITGVGAEIFFFCILKGVLHH